MNILIKKVRPGATLPEYQTENSAGLDLAACIDAPVVIQPHQRTLIPTGIAISLPMHCEAQIRGRSGLALNHGIVPANGVGTIDSDYRGEVGAILLNASDVPFTIEPGMRVAQMVIARYERIVWREADELDQTVRGSDGFSSTGLV